MGKIEALTVDHPDYQLVLDNAEMVIAGYNSGTETCIPDAYHEDVLLALVTWKKIAEERQEHLDASNEDWFNEGLDGMMRPFEDRAKIIRRIEERKRAREEKRKEYVRRCEELRKEMGL